MTAELVSKFENRDMADLAVTRLRRAGVAFSVSRLSESQLRSGGDVPPGAFNITFPYTTTATNVFDAVVKPYAPMGARAMMERDTGGYGTEAVLKVRVGSGDLHRAREILRSSHGTDIRVVI